MWNSAESPSDAFLFMRDYVDCVNCAKLEAFSPEMLRAGYSTAMHETARKKWKLNEARNIYVFQKIQANSPNPKYSSKTLSNLNFLDGFINFGKLKNCDKFTEFARICCGALAISAAQFANIFIHSNKKLTIKNFFSVKISYFHCCQLNYYAFFNIFFSLNADASTKFCACTTPTWTCRRSARRTARSCASACAKWWWTRRRTAAGCRAHCSMTSSRWRSHCTRWNQ